MISAWVCELWAILRLEVAPHLLQPANWRLRPGSSLSSFFGLSFVVHPEPARRALCMWISDPCEVTRDAPGVISLHKGWGMCMPGTQDMQHGCHAHESSVRWGVAHLHQLLTNAVDLAVAMVRSASYWDGCALKKVPRPSKHAKSLPTHLDICIRKVIK